ncbi:hypothetical protein [Sulfitobacter noctilucicola]|nr:hypothetical protein [Sulfitobacter noctilucicola]
MMCSANEVMTLADKAARGAGAPPAQATAFGNAALSHISAGCDQSELSAALRALPSGPVMALPIKIMRLLEGADQAPLTAVIEPGAFAALELSYFYAQPYAVRGKTVEGCVHVSVDLKHPKGPPVLPRVEIGQSLYDEMQRYAARILVPETAASRLSGAGAGLTDND